MSKTWRFAGMLLGVALLSAGCEKSATTGPGKPADETYGKKLVGVWEGTPEGKDDFPGPITFEFKADNSLKMTLGAAEKKSFEMTGSWKLVKEEGKTLTLDSEMTSPFDDPKGPKKTQKKTLSVVFDDADTITISEVGEKPNPLKLKRKP
jgi:hypothetical protein